MSCGVDTGVSGRLIQYDSCSAGANTEKHRVISSDPGKRGLNM